MKARSLFAHGHRIDQSARTSVPDLKMLEWEAFLEDAIPAFNAVLEESSVFERNSDFQGLPSAP